MFYVRINSMRHQQQQPCRQLSVSCQWLVRLSKKKLLKVTIRLLSFLLSFADIASRHSLYPIPKAHECDFPSERVSYVVPTCSVGVRSTGLVHTSPPYIHSRDSTCRLVFTSCALRVYTWYIFEPASYCGSGVGRRTCFFFFCDLGGLLFRIT